MFDRTAICFLAIAAPALLSQDETSYLSEKDLAIVPYEKYSHAIKFAVNKMSAPKGCVVRVEMRPIIIFKSSGPQEYGVLMTRRSTVPEVPGDAVEEKEREKARKKEEKEKKKEEKTVWQIYSMPAEKSHTWEFKLGPNGRATSGTPGLVKFYFPVTEFRYSGNMWEREIVTRTGLTYPMNRFDGIGRVDYVGRVTVLVDNKVVGTEQFKTDMKVWFFPTMEYFGSIDISFKSGKPKVKLSPPVNKWSGSFKDSAMDIWRATDDTFLGGPVNWARVGRPKNILDEMDEVDSYNLLEMIKREKLADVY